MALKRKSLDDIDSVPLKKLHLDIAEESLEQPNAALKDDEYNAKFTESGTRRADSEARRHWNYICPVESCAQRFNRPCRLEIHMRIHTNERPFACTESSCDKTFPRKDHLQRHLRNAHGNPAEERVFLCDWDACDKSFTSNPRLQRHKAVHESKFYCTDYLPCKEVFRKANVLEAHIKSQHLHLRPYPCTFAVAETGDKCTAGYQTEGALRRHINTAHSETRNDSHFCMLCIPPNAQGEMIEIESGDSITIPTQLPCFATKKELIAHTEEFHPPICSECGQKFKNAATLKGHWDTVHANPEEQAQYPCLTPGCKSVFNRKHNLTVHIQSVHEKQLKFFCTLGSQSNSKHDDLRAWNGHNACGAGFKAKSSLDQHIRTHHLGLGNRKERRKAAKSKKNSDASMLTLLTGVGYEKGRDVGCLVKTCEYRFYMDRDLRRHLSFVHNFAEAQVAEMIQERDAVAGGPFWTGGLDEHMNTFESTEPSMPQTPMSYFMEGCVPLCSNSGGGGGGEALEAVGPPQFGYYHYQQFDDLSLLDEDAEMDKAMGLDGLSAAMDVQDGLKWEHA